MATPVQIIQGKNSFLDALSASLTNVGASAAQGMADREKRIQASNVENANLLAKQLEAISTQYGGWGFDPASADALADPVAREEAHKRISENLGVLNTYIQARQLALGAPMSADEQAALRSMMTMTPNPTQKKAYFDTFGLGGGMAAPASTATAPASKPAAAGVAQVAPAASAAAQGQGMPSAVAAKVEDPVITAARQALRGAYRGNLLTEIPYDRELGAPDYATPRTVLSPTVRNVLTQPSYAGLPGVKNLLNTQYGTDFEAQTLAAQQLAAAFQNNPELASALMQALTAGAQQGVKANGTVSLREHERRTGDDHYPARVGVEEGIVNAVAMKQPGVAQLVMDLNRRFPANVAASRGTYADGDLALDEGNEGRYVPSSGQAYAQALQALGGAAADTQAQALAQRQAISASQGPAYMGAPTSGVTPAQPVDRGLAYAGASQPQQYMSTQATSDKTPLTALEQKGVLTAAPAPSEAAQIAWDRVKAHAADVQAKYQINFANPDPREKAILAKELAVENALVRKAMALDTNRKAWMKDQQKRLETYLRTASDEDIALTFGDAVAQARDRSRTRDLKAAELEILSAQADASGSVAKSLQGSLVLQSMQSILDVVKASIGKDKDGKPVWDQNMFNSMTANVPYVKNGLDIVSIVQGLNVPGVAAPTREKVGFRLLDSSTWKGGYTYGFDASGMAQEQAAAAVAPKTSTQSAADAYMKGK